MRGNLTAAHRRHLVHLLNVVSGRGSAAVLARRSLLLWGLVGSRLCLHGAARAASLHRVRVMRAAMSLGGSSRSRSVVVVVVVVVSTAVSRVGR